MSCDLLLNYLKEEGAYLTKDPVLGVVDGFKSYDLPVPVLTCMNSKLKHCAATGVILRQHQSFHEGSRRLINHRFLREKTVFYDSTRWPYEIKYLYGSNGNTEHMSDEKAL